MSDFNLHTMVHRRLVHHRHGCKRGRSRERVFGRRITDDLSQVNCSHCLHVIGKYGPRIARTTFSEGLAITTTMLPGDHFVCPICGWQDDLPAYQRTGETLDPGCNCWPNGVRISLVPWKQST